MQTHSIKAYGKPDPKAKIWHWQEVEYLKPGVGTPIPNGRTGTVQASTEMEALDRLRLDEPELGAIRWTHIE